MNSPTGESGHEEKVLQTGVSAFARRAGCEVGPQVITPHFWKMYLPSGIAYEKAYHRGNTISLSLA